MPASKAQRAETAKRRTRAIGLRLAGVDYQTIADQLEYPSRGAAYTDITRALQSAMVQQKQGAEELRHVELARLDRLQAALWGNALAGDTKSADTALRIIDRRCRLLGLDAPQRHEVITLSQIDEEIRRLTQELGSAAAGEVPDALGSLDDVEAGAAAGAASPSG